jgi:nucleotide-binding universal stress UspA family protein
MVYLVVAVLWLAVGAAVGVIEARHGSWSRGWVVSAVLGPLAVPLAMQRRRQAPPAPTVLETGQTRRGTVDLLIGMDGSAASRSAAMLAVRLFGPRVRRVAFATVLDVDTAAPHADNVLHPQPWPEEQAARSELQSAVAELRDQLEVNPTAVILAGDPAQALERYALDEGYEVIVVGCQGKGVSKLLLGSCAAKLSRKTRVPVFLIPAEPASAVPGLTAAIAPPASR